MDLIQLAYPVGLIRDIYGKPYLNFADVKRPGSIFKSMEIGSGILVYLERDGTFDVYQNGDRYPYLSLKDFVAFIGGADDG